MSNAVTGSKSAMDDATPESLKEVIREAARRASPKVVEALSKNTLGSVLPIKTKLMA